MLRSISSSLIRANAHLRFSHSFNALRSLQNPDFQNLVSGESVRAVHLSSIRLIGQANIDGVDRMLHRLDNEIRRTGRIARQEIDEVLQDIRDMKKATSSQSLMIIRCCGDLVPSETPENRTKLVQEVLKTMENLNVPMDISHYNAVLRVYLENEHKFNPTEFLQDLSTKGIEPNRVTYQRLIARFCQEGDIDGASTILLHMKEKQLPINEHVFNALINGHAQADDMESAEGILSVMKQAGLEPNDDSYVTLMCGYAKKGDMENIRRIVKDCNEKEIFLIDRDFLNVIYTLTSNGHENLVDEIIPLLKKHTGFNQDATNLILRLVNIQREDVAYRILKEMTRLSRNDEVLPSGNFFISQLVLSATPSETVIKYCQTMVTEGLNKFALSKACECALSSKKFEKAADFFEALKETGAPLRQHYFWPFFASSQTEKDIYDGLKCMKFLEIPPTNETLRDYIIPALFKQSQKGSAEKTLEKLSSFTGIPMAAIVPAAMQHLLNEKSMELAAQFASKYRLRFTNPQLRRSIVESYLKDQNAKTFVRIIGSTGLSGEDGGREAVGIMLMELIESLRSKERANLLLPVLNELLSLGLGLSNSGSELIQNNLGEELTPEIANLILQLTSGELSPKFDLYQQQKKAGVLPAFDEKTTAELENMLEESIEAGKPTRSVKKALLFKYCREKDIDKAEKMKQDLASEGFIFPSGLQALLLDLYSQCDKLDEARQTYSNLMKSVDIPIDDVKILRYAYLLLSNDQYNECLEVLKNTPRDENRKPLGAVQQATVWKMLNNLAESGNVEKVQEMFQILRDRNLAHTNNVVLGSLVKVHLIKDDLVGALAEFERCVKEFNATPWKQELFCRFIKAEDTDKLQRVMDLSTNLHGEVNSMYDLVFAFIQCGKVRQAKKILETPGLRARNDKIEMTCQKYLEENRVLELENLIQITKEMMDIDRNAMYFYLLQCYCKAGDPDKALSVWTSLQEENIQASAELLSFLADFLRKNDKPIPFVQPEPSKSESKPSSKTSKILVDFHHSIEANEIDKALQIKQRIDGDGSKLGIGDFSALVDKLTRAERLGEATRLIEEMFESGLHPFPRTLRFVLGRLAAAGEVDVLNRFSNKLTPDLKRQTMFNTRLSVAYTNAGRGREYFEKYIKGDVSEIIKSESTDSNESFNVSLAGSTYILLRNEDLLGDYEELAVQAEQKGNMVLFNTLWNYHLLKKNFEKSKEIWETKLKKESRVLFRSVLIESRVKKDEQIAKELSNLIMSSESLSDATKGMASSSVIDVLCNNGKADEALSYLQENLKAVKLEHYNSSALKLLKEKLEAVSKKFPYEIPKKDTRGRKTVSSAGSDSD